MRCFLQSRLRALLVPLIVALPALAAAQAPLAPGMQTHWCSDRLCSGAGTARITKTVPAAPCDPWADGLFQPLSPIDLACFWQRYGGFPWTPPVVGWIGAWCAQHSPCDSIPAQWATVDPRTWTWGGGCLEPGSLGRAACDAIHTAGATLGCTMLPCGVVSCPAAPRTCSGGGANCPAGWRCTPLVDLPASERPGAVANGRAVKLKVTAPNGDGCSFFHLSGASVYVPNRPACFAGLPENCQTAASLRAECWSAPEPEPPVEPPAPAVALEILDCDPTGWRIRTAAGEDRVAVGAEVTVGGVTVRLPVACSGACPEAAILDRACGEVR